MPSTQINVQDLQYQLRGCIERTHNERPVTANIFQTLYNTGLRVREVLEVERWRYDGSTGFMVQLEKGEAARFINQAALPTNLLPRYINQVPYKMETYSAVNNTFKYYGPVLFFGTDKRRTTSHAFRYAFIQAMYKAGKTIQEIAAEMGHMNEANTAAYATAAIWYYQ